MKAEEEYSIGASIDIFLISQSRCKWERNKDIAYYPEDRTMISIVFRRKSDQKIFSIRIRQQLTCLINTNCNTISFFHLRQ